jgi:hypothetical protein
MKNEPWKERKMAKIKLTDNLADIFFKLSEGNPGALNVLVTIVKDEDIDPDDFLGPLGTLLSFDTHQIYGSNIWILYKDICGESIVKTVAVLRACQLGFIAEEVIHQAINIHSAIGILDPDNLYQQVKKRLPRFKTLPC